MFREGLYRVRVDVGWDRLEDGERELVGWLVD